MSKIKSGLFRPLAKFNYFCLAARNSWPLPTSMLIGTTFAQKDFCFILGFEVDVKGKQIN